MFCGNSGKDDEIEEFSIDWIVNCWKKYEKMIDDNIISIIDWSVEDWRQQYMLNNWRRQWWQWFDDLGSSLCSLIISCYILAVFHLSKLVHRYELRAYTRREDVNDIMLLSHWNGTSYDVLIFSACQWTSRSPMNVVKLRPIGLEW